MAARLKVKGIDALTLTCVALMRKDTVPRESIPEILNQGRTNRRNTAKTSVDRNTRITLALTIAGCN